MNITRIERQAVIWRQEQANLQYQRDEDYRKLIEKRRVDQLALDRVARNRRLDLNRGTHIDVEV